MWKKAFRQDGKINQRKIFPPDADHPGLVPVREFFIWFRQYDEKDSIRFYTDTEDLVTAIKEAHTRLPANFAIVYNGRKVMQNGKLIRENL